jgi:RNA polymerase sigma-70 factor (ECF subfamily)
MGNDDSELAARAAAGDGDAFGLLVDRHAPVARRLAWGILDNPQDADDAAQDGFLAAWRHIDRYRPEQAFGPWLMKIVINAARDLRRKRTVRQVSPLDDRVPGRGPTPEEATDAALLWEALDRGLRTVPENQRVAVLMHDVAGYSHADVAEALDCPQGTARSLVFHGRRRLRVVLQPFTSTRPAPGQEPDVG